MAKPRVPEGYAEAFLHCRTFGHTWSVAKPQLESLNFYRFVLSCSVCRAKRYDLINGRSGMVVANSRTYEYPEGYQSQAGQALPRTSYRVEFIKRFKADG